MECNVTGQKLPPRPEGQRGQPKRYLTEPARRYRHRVSELAGLILDLQKVPGVTPEAAARMRGELFRLGNLVRVSGRALGQVGLVALGIRLPESLLQKIDADRPRETRSESIRRILTAHYKD